MSTTSALGSSYFSGSSSYSDQLQQTISRAVTIASLPMDQLKDQQNVLTGQQSELQTLTNTFASMQSAVGALSNSTGSGAFAVSVGNTSIATAAISDGVMAGQYTIDVTSVGSQTNAVSQSGLTTVTDPGATNINSSSNYTLTVNGNTYSLSNSSGTLNGLAQAITNSSANVQATVVNVGTSTSPDYRLSIQSLDYAPDTIQLNDGTNDLLTTLSTGSNVTYQVNGQPSTPISSSSRNVTLSPGLSVQLLTTGTTQVTVAQSSAGLENGLASFANAYNSVVTELNKNRGQNGGSLAGQSVVYEIQNELRNLANFSTASGSVNSLSSLGLSFDDSGHLSFDSATFAQTASTSAGDLLNFIGTSTSGGFLQAANSMIASVTDPDSGILTGASQDTASQISNLTTKISNDQAQITQLQASLTAQMASADAAISSLEQQLTEITTLFSTIQANEKANG